MRLKDDTIDKSLWYKGAVGCEKSTLKSPIKYKFEECATETLHKVSNKLSRGEWPLFGGL